MIAAEYSDKANIFCFSETWACAENVHLLHFENFTNVSNFCRSTQKGGGVGIWCHKDINTEHLKLSVDCVERDFELCGILLNDMHSDESWVLLTCYRAPGSDVQVFCDNLVQVMDSIYKPNRQIILVGDFNIDPSRDIKDYTLLCDILSCYNIINIISNPTRGDNVLDHVYTNNSSVSCMVKDNNFSDHRSLFISVKKHVSFINAKQTCVRRVFSENSIQSFFASLNGEDWMSVFGEANVDNAFDNFHQTLLHYFNVHFPLKRISVRTSKTLGSIQM